MPGDDDQPQADLFGRTTPRRAASAKAGAAAPPVAYALVAPERGVDTGAGGFTYAVPPHLAGLQAGRRVVVPLGRGNKPVAGYVLEVTPDCPLPEDKRAKVKPIASLDEHGVWLTGDLVRLARWLASYYVCPLGMVFGTMLPAAVKHGTGATTRCPSPTPSTPS